MWDSKQVARFETLVGLEYGYRMFLDDLPSAIRYEHQTHNDWLIPLGYVPPRESTNAAEQNWKPIRGVAIYNHLDIKIKVHPTSKSNLFGNLNTTMSEEAFK